jgi:hypothetical protein
MAYPYGAQETIISATPYGGVQRDCCTRNVSRDEGCISDCTFERHTLFFRISEQDESNVCRATDVFADEENDESRCAAYGERTAQHSDWFLRHLVLAMVSAWSGALFGLAVQLMSNALQKLPLMRRPWEHVLFAAGGAFVGHKLGDLEVELTQRIEAHRANQKRPGS